MNFTAFFSIICCFDCSSGCSFDFADCSAGYSADCFAECFVGYFVDCYCLSH